MTYKKNFYNDDNFFSKTLLSRDYGIYNAYYFDLAVQYEMIKFLYNREFCMIPLDKVKTLRYRRVHNSQGFQHWRKYLWHEFGKKFFNFYYSLAEYREGLIRTEWTSMEDWQETKEAWNKKYISEMVGYDFVVDIDSPSHQKREMELARDTALMVHKHFQKIKVPHEIRFSGKGFHIVTHHGFIPEMSLNPEDKINCYKILTKILKILKKEFSDLIDTGILDSKRVIKIPYSLAVYSDLNMYICLPILKTKFLERFTLKKAEIDYWKDKIRDRGTFIFSGTNNFKNLLDYYGIDIDNDKKENNTRA